MTLMWHKCNSCVVALGHLESFWLIINLANLSSITWAKGKQCISKLHLSGTTPSANYLRYILLLATNSPCNWCKTKQEDCNHTKSFLSRLLTLDDPNIAVNMVPIHNSHEIAILEFPTSDCSQNEAWCHAKRTDVTVPIENTWRRPNQHCKFNALVARIDDHSIVFNYAVWARCHHTVLNWPVILSERFVWCLKMTFNMRYRWKRGAHARAARRRVGCTQSHKIPHKINFYVNIAVSR